MFCHTFPLPSLYFSVLHLSSCAAHSSKSTPENHFSFHSKVQHETWISHALHTVFCEYFHWPMRVHSSHYRHLQTHFLTGLDTLASMVCVHIITEKTSTLLLGWACTIWTQMKCIRSKKWGWLPDVLLIKNHFWSCEYLLKICISGRNESGGFEGEQQWVWQ